MEGLPEVVLGAMTGLLLGPAIAFGPVASALALWGSIRERDYGYLLIASLATPLSAFVWWQMFFGSIPATKLT